MHYNHVEILPRITSCYPNLRSNITMVPTDDDPYVQIQFVPGTGQSYIHKVTEPGRETRMSSPSAWALTFAPGEHPSSSHQAESRLK